MRLPIILPESSVPGDVILPTESQTSVQDMTRRAEHLPVQACKSCLKSSRPGGQGQGGSKALFWASVCNGAQGVGGKDRRELRAGDCSEDDRGCWRQAGRRKNKRKENSPPGQRIPYSLQAQTEKPTWCQARRS